MQKGLYDFELKPFLTSVFKFTGFILISAFASLVGITLGIMTPAIELKTYE